MLSIFLKSHQNTSIYSGKNIHCSCHRNAIMIQKYSKRTYSLQHFHNQGTDISQSIEITFTYFDIEEGIVKIYTD